MRRPIDHVLNEQVDVDRASTVSDGMGGWVTSWQQVAVEPARISTPKPSEREAANKSEAQITHDVYLHVGADVQRGDRLHVRGLVLDVQAVTVPSIKHHAKAACSSTQVE